MINRKNLGKSIIVQVSKIKDVSNMFDLKRFETAQEQ